MNFSFIASIEKYTHKYIVKCMKLKFLDRVQ